MFRRGYGGKGPLSTVLSGILAAIVVAFVLYIVYKLFIVGDGVEAGGVTEVLANIVEKGVEIGKSIADYIVNLFGGGGPTEIAPSDTENITGVVMK